MTHLSRPFQLVLVVFGLFAITWLVVLHGHNASSSSSGSSSASAPTQPAGTHAASTSKAHPGAGASKAHTSAPAAGVVHSHTSVSVHGAHGTVHASSSSTRTDHLSKPASTHTDHVTRPDTASTRHTATTRSSRAGAAVTGAGAGATHAARAGNGSKTGAAGAPAMQATVERELAQNKTVVILFWSPRGAEDIAVRQQLPIAARALGGTVAVHYALPHQVTEYGKITNAVQVNQTPTILVVNKHGQATTLTGLTDAFAIEQAVAEARSSR